MARRIGRLAVLAWTAATLGGGLLDATAQAAPPEPGAKPAVAKFTVGTMSNYVNVMGKEAPPIPKFPPLDKKPGVVHGYIKDAAGNPLQGAVVGVRATLVGGRYSGASAESDEEGYYEIQVPYGAAHFYTAGYTVDYGDGRAALALHPADGKLESFTSEKGSVENFVLLTYGIASRDELSEHPSFGSTYYGGVLYIGHHTAEPNDTLSPPNYLRTGTEIVVTLTPEGPLLDGSAGKTFSVRKAVDGTGFSLINIPVGIYKIEAKRADGQPLNMRLNKPMGLAFGITPTETTGEATLTLYPDGANAAVVTPARGNWESVEVYVDIPESN